MLESTRLSVLEPNRNVEERASLAVIGNISLDSVSYPDGRTYRQIGGAALRISVAATSRCWKVAPVSVVGEELAWITNVKDNTSLDWADVKVSEGPSCRFLIRYDSQNALKGVDCRFGVAVGLTEHALLSLDKHSYYHICCRRPLDVPRTLAGVIERSKPFTLDFYPSSAAALLSDALPLLPSAEIIFTNEEEFAILSSLSALESLRAVVVTNGPREVRLFRHGELAARAMPPRAFPRDVTGAGDTLIGCYLREHAQGRNDALALARAVHEASSSIERTGALISRSD